MSTRLGWHGRLAVALAAFATLVVAAPAGAATTVRLSGGTTSVKLAKTFKQAGVKVSPAKPAKNKSGSVVFPISGGSIDPATAKGTITHKGGLTFKMGQGKFTLTNPTLNTAKGTLSFRLGRQTVVVGSAKGGKVTRNGFATNVAGVKLTLNKRAALTFNSAFGIRSFKAGQPLGTATVASQPAEVAIESGAIDLTFTQATLGALGQLRIAPAPIAPATLDPATFTLRFPVTRGTLDPRTLAGSVLSSGGLSLARAGSAPVELTQPVITLSTTPQLAVTFGGASVAIADLDISRLTRTVDPRARTIALTGAGVKLNAVAATTLNALFGLSGPASFTAGTEIAIASLNAQAR